MKEANYDVLVRNGKERFIVIPEKEYEALRERLEDESDFRAIEASKRRNAGVATTSHTEIMRQFGVKRARKRK